MKDHQGAKVVIVDDEPNICDMIQALLEHWGLAPVSFDRPGQAVTHIKNNGCDLVLLDVFFPDTSGFDAMPDIRAFCPQAKVIIMTGYADKDNAVKALKLGAFDFLEKPFAMEVLRKAVQRALDARAGEERLTRLLAELQQSELDLTRQKEQLKGMNEHLLAINRAMSVLAQNISREREETEKQLARKLRTLVLPVLKQLVETHPNSHPIRELEQVVSSLAGELVNGLSMDSKVAAVLSFSELRVASLIKNGLTTAEIADQLHVALATVKTHRRNIRKKIGIVNNSSNLNSFLAVIPGDLTARE